MPNPFAMQPIDQKTALKEDAVSKPLTALHFSRKDVASSNIYFNEVDKNGNVGKYKMESGVPVKVADLGNIKDYFQQAIMKASVMTPDDIMATDFGELTHIEIAAIKLAAYAAAGDLKSTQELFDRVLGKAKQVSESTNLNLTIDDILNGVQGKKEGEDIVDVEAQ